MPISEQEVAIIARAVTDKVRRELEDIIPKWMPATVTAVSGTIATIHIDGDPVTTTVDAHVVTGAPTVDERVMVLWSRRAFYVFATLGAWKAYTPTWTTSGTAPAIGNGTLKGAYLIAGKTLFLRITWIAGSTTTFGTGEFRFSLPSGITGFLDADVVQVAPVYGLDSGTLHHHGVARLLSNAAYMTLVSETSSVWQNTVPFTWAANDVIDINAVFQIA